MLKNVRQIGYLAVKSWIFLYIELIFSYTVYIYMYMYLYIYIQGGTELFPRQNFNPRIDASHKILTYSLDCRKCHEGKYDATFFDHFCGWQYGAGSKIWH